jgi:hypothetical protein
MIQRKRKTNFIVDSDDHKLFEYLYCVKSATSKQIKRDVYPSHTKRAVSQRLDKFIAGDLLICRLCKKVRRQYIYSITPFTYKEYLSLRGESVITLKSDKIYHDLLLVEVRNIFLHSKYVTSYYTENELISWHGEGEPDHLLGIYAQMRSDGCVSISKNDKTYYLGVELEISRKSYERYKEVLAKYYSSNHSDIILYITSDEALMNKIIEIEQQFFSKFDSKIYYQCLDSFLEDDTIVFFDRDKKELEIGPRFTSGPPQLQI